MAGADDKPLLVLSREGKGRVALLLSDQMWLWARGYEGGGPYLDLLRRLAHWLMKEPDLEEEALRAKAPRPRADDRAPKPKTANAARRRHDAFGQDGHAALGGGRVPACGARNSKPRSSGCSGRSTAISPSWPMPGRKTRRNFKRSSRRRRSCGLAEATGGTVRRIADGEWRLRCRASSPCATAPSMAAATMQRSKTPAPAKSKASASRR